MKDDFKFKKCKVNGKEYLQIWHNNKFKITAGSPYSLYKKLVKLQFLEDQTKKRDLILTKISEGIYDDID